MEEVISVMLTEVRRDNIASTFRRKMKIKHAFVSNRARA
jgi:hypothetical protein